MAGKEFKAKDKKVLKGTKDGAVEQNLVTNTMKKVSKRAKDVKIKKDADFSLTTKKAPLNKDSVSKVIANRARHFTQMTEVGLVKSENSGHEEDDVSVNVIQSTEKIANPIASSMSKALKKAYKNHVEKPAKASKLKFEKEPDGQNIANNKIVAGRKSYYERNNAFSRVTMKKAQQKQNQRKAVNSKKKVKERIKDSFQDFGKKVIEEVKSHKFFVVILVIIIVLFSVFGTLTTSCCSTFVSKSTYMIATSYTAKEKDIYSANDYLTSLESNLLDYLNHIPDYYVGWDEYHYFYEDVGHDPYMLISYLSAMKLAFKYDKDIQKMIKEIYDEIYVISTVTVHQVRTRKHTEIDENGNKVVITEQYDYNILSVYLNTKDFETVIKPKLEKAGVYDLYLAMQANKGGKPNLF